MYNVKVSGNKFIAYLVMLTKLAFMLVGSKKVLVAAMTLSFGELQLSSISWNCQSLLEF